MKHLSEQTSAGWKLARTLDFQNHAPHSSRKHIFDFQHFSYRCKCPQFMFCCQHRSLSSCFDRHTGLSEFALSLVNCAQLSSWARTANTHGNIGCAFYASTAAQNTPEQLKEAQIQPRAARFSQEQPRSSQNHLRSKQNQPKSSQELLKSANIKPTQTVIINWPILMSIRFLPVTSTRLRIRNSRS